MTRPSRGRAPTACLVTLGCPKNEADSARLAALLAEAGFRLTARPERADAVLVNTCGFLEIAREEARRELARFARLKKSGRGRGRVQVLLALGCGVEIAASWLARRVPKLDACVGFKDYPRIGAIARALLEGADPGEAPPGFDFEDAPRLAEGRATAYLKIAEGCDNRCAYCTIPRIRGPRRSRPIEALVAEAACLARAGVRELVLVAQDTADYGRDLYGAPVLVDLLDALEEVDALRWVRVMYAHPAHVDAHLIARLGRGRVVPYLDLPIQHASPRLLRRMGRRVTRSRLAEIVAALRAREVAIRTTVIAGLPGETAREFAGLMDFLEEVRFDHLGAFVYSREPGTRAARMSGQVRRDVAARRRARVMRLARRQAIERGKRLVGARVEAIVEARSSRDAAAGRTAWDAPEVDGRVRLRGRGLEEGRLLEVAITGAAGYDLEARVPPHRNAGGRGRSARRRGTARA